MTTADLHRAFKIELDKSEISSYPSFLPEEIDYWLNKAYLMIVNQKFTGSNPSKVGFEQSDKRVSDLMGLIKTASNVAIPCTSSPSSAARVSDFLYFVDGTIKYKLDSVSGPNTISNVKPISHRDSDNFKKTRTNTPVIIDPVITQDASGFNIYYDEMSVFSLSGSNMEFTYRYIAYPAKIVYSSMDAVPAISAHVHPEIANLAAFLAIENIESGRVQTSGQLLNIQE